MPKIFDAPANIAPSGGGGRRASEGDVGGFGRGMVEFGGAISGIGDILQVREEREDVTRVQTMRSASMADLTNLSMSMESEAAAGAPGHVKKTRQAVNDRYDKLKDEATTKKGKQLLEVQRAEVLGHFTIQSSTFQAAAVGKKVKSDFTTSTDIDLNTISMSRNPDAAIQSLLKFQIAKIYDKDGVLFRGLKTAESRDALAREVTEKYTAALVTGLIRKNPTVALERLRTNEFAKTLDPEKTLELERSAKTAISSEKTAARARIKEEERLVGVAREAEGRVIFDMMHLGEDENGNAVTPDQTRQRILDNNILKPDGANSKKSWLEAFTLRARGITTADHDAAVRLEQLNMLNIVIKGTDLAGNEVTHDQLVERALDPDSPMNIFGSGSLATILEMNAAKIKRQPSANDALQTDILTMVLTGKDVDGNDLTYLETVNMINTSNLAATGVGGKTSFISMARELQRLRNDETSAASEDAYYARVLLPPSDPNHLSVGDLGSAEIIGRIGFDKADKLRKIAENLLDPEKGVIELAKQDVFSRFKPTITTATLTKNDKQGDEFYYAFRQEVDRRVQAKIKAGEDPMILFDDREGNKEYVGLLVGNYLRPIEKQSDAVRRRFSGEPFTPVTSARDGAVTSQNTPNAKLPGETPAEYLSRMSGK